MTASILNFIVEKYLANIVEINPEETSSSLIGGYVEMNNLKIKQSIFTQLNLPYFELVYGYIGSLKVQMSSVVFFTNPIKITIDKVFFHARQKSLENLNEESETKAMEEYKEAKLSSMEEFSSQVHSLQYQEPGMVQKMMNNLQIEIGDVMFRFDDEISIPGTPFMFGAILKKILIKTTTDKWEEKNEYIPFGEINRKVIRLEGLSLFLDYSNLDMESRIVGDEKKKVTKDLITYLGPSQNYYYYCLSEINHHSKNADAHHYLLWDLNMSIRSAMNENIKGNLLPKISLDISIENLLLNMELKQLTLIFKLLAYFNLKNLYTKGIYKSYYNKQLSNEEQKVYMQKYIEYYKHKYVKKYLNAKQAEVEKSELKSLEAHLTYDQVQSMRQASMIRISYLFEMENYDNKLNEINARWSMFSYFRNDEEEKKAVLDRKEKLQGEEAKYEQMIQEQLALQKAIEIDMYKDLPDTWINYSLNLELKKCVLAIGELDCRKLVDFEFIDFEVKMFLGLTFQNIFLYLRDFNANQYKLKHPYFNRIIESFDDEVVKNPVQSKPTTNIKEVSEFYSTRKGAMYIEFENNPKNISSNYRFKLRNERRLYIFANIYALQYTAGKVVEALKSNIDMSEISNYAQGEVKKYIEEGYVDKIFSGEYQHFNIEVDIHLKGPVLVIPQNILDLQNTSCMLLSMGECYISSALPPRMDPLVDYTRITDQNKLYDVYTIVTQGFGLSTMGDFTSISSIATSKTKLDIIDNINIEIKIGNLIQPKNDYFENLKLSFKILNTQLFFRDIQIEYMIFFLDALTEVSKLLKSEEKSVAIEKMPTAVLEESVVKNTDPEGKKIEEEKIAKPEQSLPRHIQSSISTTRTVKKDKLFVSIIFELIRLEINIMKSLSVEERALFSKSGLSPSSPFKNFLNFVINNFNFTVQVTDKMDTKVSLKLFNMFFFDYDFMYRSQGSSNPQQEPLLNQEFQCIMGSINEDYFGEGDFSRSQSLYSEAHADPEVMLKNQIKKVDSFIQINYEYKSSDSSSNIKINFTKLLICLNLSTFARLTLFGKYYSNLFAKIASSKKRDAIMDRMSLKKEISQLKELKEAKRLVKPSQDINRKFFKNVAKKMAKRKENLGKSEEIVVTEPKRRYSSKTIKTEALVPPNVNPIINLSKLNFSFEMKEIELNIPLKADEDTTKVLKLNFNMLIKLRNLTETESWYHPQTSKLLKQNFIKKNMNLNLMVFNVDFDVINFRNNMFIANTISNKILSNSRVTLGLKSFLLLDRETSVTNIDIHVEPISMVIGFRQVKILTHYLEAFKKFNEETSKSSGEELSEPVNVSKQEFSSKISQKIQEIDEKMENYVKYNTSSFNNLTDLSFKLDKAIIKMIDNTGYYDIPLTKIEASKIACKFISNSDPRDCDNFAQALVEMISGQEVTLFNIYNLYLYTDACFNAEILAYNEKVSDWEPIMEPWNASLKVNQVNKLTRLKIDFTSDVMLNLNLSYSTVGTFNGILKKFSEDESKWFEEDKKLELAAKVSKRKLSLTNSHEVCLEILNLTGIEFAFWFLADTGNKMLLKNGDKKMFTRQEMSDIYKSLTDLDLSLHKKDKLSFSLFNCDPIENVDFSYNHYSNIRIPLNKTSVSIYNEFNFIELSIKIRNSGLIRTIVIESNMTIHNNTDYKISLNVLRTRDLMENFNRGIGTVNETSKLLGMNNINMTQPNDVTSSSQLNMEESIRVDIEPNKFIKVPLTWMFEAHSILGGILDEESRECKKLIYNELNFIYKLRDIIKEQDQTQTEEEKENLNKKYTNTYSQIISYDLDTKQVNFSYDLLVLKSNSDLRENLNSGGIENTYSYLVVINPPIVIENQIPYNLNFSYGHEGPEEVCSTPLPSLQKYPIFYVNYLDNRTDLKLTMDYFEGNYESSLFSFLDEVHKDKKKIKLYSKSQSSVEEDFYEVTINYGTTEHLNNIFNYNFLKVEKNFSKSKKMTFYVEYLVVNKCDSKMFIKSLENKVPDDKIKSLSCNTLYPHKVNLFNLQNEGNKIKIKSEISEWSTENLNIETHGMDGLVQLISKTPANNEIQISTKRNSIDAGPSIISDVGINITSSSYFYYSTVVIFSPGYVLVNKTGLVLNCRQMINEHDACKESFFLKNEDYRTLSFILANGNLKDLKRYYQFSLEGSEKLLTPDDHHDEQWSSTINLSQPEEYNFRLLCPKSFQETHKENVFTYDGVNYYLLLRINVHTNDNSLKYVILTLAKYPQIVIRNTSKIDIEMTQDGNTENKFSSKSNRITISAGSEKPFVWPNLIAPNKNAKVKISGNEIGISLANIDRWKVELPGENKNIKNFAYFSILMENNNKTRVLCVQTDDSHQEEKEVKEILSGKKTARRMKFNMSLLGFGLSIIDETPRELFYISTYCLDLKYANSVLKTRDYIENIENIMIYVKNFQIDYCLEDSFKFIFFPKNQILPSNEVEKKKEGKVEPFFSLLITRVNEHDLVTDNKTAKISQIDLTLQEMCLKIDQGVLNTFVTLLNSLMALVDFHKTNEKYSSNKKELSQPEDYCPMLKTSFDDFDKMIEGFNQSSMIFIEKLLLGALKISLTLRIDISSLEISIIPGFIIKILGTVGNAIARITDSPLRFTELEAPNLFTDVNRLVSLFISHYKTQGITQFYKILGSSDLIGNPVGLVDRLGTGFIEFFNEPRKGFKDGPKGIGQGVAKGINSLVSNVVGGGFDTVGKITGTLLTATKNLQGEKVNLREEDEPDNVITGAYDGVKGGLKEIGSGLAGIFINPYKNAKQEGVKGFFKGVGTGLLGAIISPFTAVLKVSNSLAVGLRNTATYFNRGKLKTERFRHPRHIIVNEPLKPYDETFAEVQAILRTLGTLDTKLIFFADFLFMDQDLGNEVSTLIVTDKRIIVVYLAKEKVFECDILSVRNTEVHLISGNYLIIFFRKDGKKEYVMTNDVSICCQVHGILQKLLGK